jgi:hypothetical protein
MGIGRPPAEDQVEFTLIGPGYGESIVIHCGANQWIIVDSCWSNDSPEPEAISYLKELGVDPATSVRAVIATHWHDDHIRGMARLIDVCFNARFFCSGAVCSREFFSLMQIFNAQPMSSSTTGLSEIFKTFKILQERGTVVGRALENKILLRDALLDPPVEISVSALSPSDFEFNGFLGAIIAAFPGAGEPKRRYLEPRLNILQ